MARREFDNEKSDKDTKTSDRDRRGEIIAW
jgi:hypothetical protein